MGDIEEENAEKSNLLEQEHKEKENEIFDLNMDMDHEKENEEKELVRENSIKKPEEPVMEVEENNEDDDLVCCEPPQRLIENEEQNKAQTDLVAIPVELEGESRNSKNIKEISFKGSPGENEDGSKVLKSIRKIEEDELDSNIEEKKEANLEEDNIGKLNQVEAVEVQEEKEEVILKEEKEEIVEKEIIKEEVKEIEVKEEVKEIEVKEEVKEPEVKEEIREEVKEVEVKEEAKEQGKTCSKCNKDFPQNEMIQNSENYNFS